MNESDEQITILFELDREMLFALLGSVNYRLEHWAGPADEEKVKLQKIKRLLFAGSLEFQFDD